MERRSFVKASLLTGAAATFLSSSTQAKVTENNKAGLEFYELKVYTFASEAQQKLVEEYYSKAAVPALNRAGVQHIGVFTELKPAAQTKVYVFIPYKSLDQLDAVNAKLESDAVYQQEGSAYLNAPASSPAYDRIESSLMKAFAQMPKIEIPPAKTRIFELRQYQSASESAGKKKIEMFNDEGEIAIFKRLGFKPVFWGETIIGGLRPNLTYMVTFDDMEAHGKLWKAFGSDAEWKKISSVPDYADSLLVSKITSTFIIPTAYSQI